MTIPNHLSEFSVTRGPALGRPTLQQLEELSSQCSADEWRMLATNGEFLKCSNIAEMRKVAKSLLGRDPASRLVKTNSQDSQL